MNSLINGIGVAVVGDVNEKGCDKDIWPVKPNTYNAAAKASFSVSVRAMGKAPPALTHAACAASQFRDKLEVSKQGRFDTGTEVNHSYIALGINNLMYWMMTHRVLCLV